MPAIQDYQREYRRINKRRLQIQNAQRREEWRIILLELIGHSKCTDCGNSDIRVLQFDHARGGKEHNVSYWLNRNWGKALEEASKCEVVCANCHVLRTRERLPQHHELPPSAFVRSRYETSD